MRRHDEACEDQSARLISIHRCGGEEKGTLGYAYGADRKRVGYAHDRQEIAGRGRVGFGICLF